MQEYSVKDHIKYLEDRIKNLEDMYAKAVEMNIKLVDKMFSPQVPKYNGCSVCGIGNNGEVMGYVCPRTDCPTRVTC